LFGVGADTQSVQGNDEAGVTDWAVRAKDIEGRPNLAGLNEVFADMEEAVILGGNECESPANKFSYWMAEPRMILEIRGDEANPLGRLGAEIAAQRCAGTSGQLPTGVFCGGWAGYFSYDLGRFIEKIPRKALDDLGMPLARLGFYDRVICWDRTTGRGWMIVLEESGGDLQAGFRWLEEQLRRASGTRVAVPQGTSQINSSMLKSNMTREYYFAAMERIRRHIWDGDFYQVNFSQRFEMPFEGRAGELFQWQGLYNPCPYAAFLNGRRFKVVSASMEMFITICGRRIWTRPIKGTRRRVPGDTAANNRNRLELEESAKERAELNMIIDLERNDLGRVCEYGSIRVEEPRRIEEYPTVFHALATVGGRLRDGTGLCDVLRAMFPGGSITGAPKIRAMQAIEELEPVRRGLYTGSIGCVGIDGNVCLNIAIRTIIISGGLAFVQTGGGIVADSQPQKEWEETLVKAEALVCGIEAVRRSGRRCS
jgi:para-aminobenzoate synthetase component 1